MTNEKLKEVYYHPDHHQTGSKTIRELHKITSILKKDANSWLAIKHFEKFIYYPLTK